MKRQWPPDAAPVLQQLADPSDLIYRALSAGCDRGVQYFEADKDGKIDPWLHSDITRHHARKYLATNGIGDFGFELRPLSFSGPWLRSGTLDARLLKVDRYKDPITGAIVRRIQPQGLTRAKSQYYYQPPLEYDTDTSPGWGQLLPTRVKVVLLWETDPDFQLSEIAVACPKWVNPARKAVETHWWVRLPRGGTAAQTRLPEPIDEGPLLPEVELDLGSEDEAASSDET